MSIKYIEEYRDQMVAWKLVEKIKEISHRKVRLMEVCGTHTMSIFRSGIRTLLPGTISLISGPGCPVCVTTQGDIDAFIALARQKDVIVTTFGDLLRVPGTDSSLQKERANGRDIRVVYSTIDALETARKNPGKKIVFLGVGFETTAPTIAASILTAAEARIENYFVYSAHKLVPPALAALMETEDIEIDGFILPGHVSVIIGTSAYSTFSEKYQVPCVVSGFEPADILQAIFGLVGQLESGCAALVNGYQRAVTSEGNVQAKKIMQEVFETADVSWRGIGFISKSGLKLKKEFESFDAQRAFQIPVTDSEDVRGCACGEILRGLKDPPECPLYKKICTPLEPVGPCMVSSEGTCAAFYRYDGNYPFSGKSLE